MSKTITQTVAFKGASAKDVYNLYMDAKKHSEATGAPAEISKKVGEKFKAHKGYIRGQNLLVKANKMVVQSWRARGWDKSQPDSILTLNFADTADGCEVTMVHALVPDDAAAEVKKGWTANYWKPFKAYFKTKA